MRLHVYLYSFSTLRNNRNERWGLSPVSRNHPGPAASRHPRMAGSKHTVSQELQRDGGGTPGAGRCSALLLLRDLVLLHHHLGGPSSTKSGWCLYQRMQVGGARGQVASG